MNGLFIHDHRFPMYEGKVLNSTGFDDVFSSRYLSLFGSFSIFARVQAVDGEEAARRTVFNPAVRVEGAGSLMSLLLSRRGRQGMKQAISKADCCVVRLPSATGLVALHHIRKVKKPYLVEVVGCVYDALTTGKRPGRILIARLMMWLVQREVRKAPFVVYVTKDFLQSRYPTRGRSIACSNVEITPPGPDVLAQRLRALAAAPSRTIRLGTVSTYNVGYKGQEFMIRALASLRSAGYDAVYSMVGDGAPDTLMAAAREAGVADAVEFLGRLPHAGVLEWLKGLDIYVHPSLTEGLARTIIEAMSRACPAVVTDAGGSPELVDSRYVCPKRDSASLAAAVKDLLDGRLLEQAERNYRKSFEYASEVLRERRRGFFQEFFRSFHEV